MYEELMSQEETRRAMELKRYFAVLPAFRSLYKAVLYDFEDIVSETITNPYHSANEKKLTQEELRHFLIEQGLLEEQIEPHPDKRHWP